MKARKKLSHSLKGHECHSITCLRRHKYHRLIHKIHYKRRLSYRTLFYMKEYGPKSHVATVIVKESLKILILASIISSIGGIHIRSVQNELLAILPLLILLPALADMIGDFGIIISSKFTTMLYLGFVKKDWWHSEKVHELIFTILAIAVISGIYMGSLSYAIAAARGFALSTPVFAKLLLVSLISVIALVGIIIAISITGSLWIYRKKEDPNNFLIPITTSVADLGSLTLFAFMVSVFF